jgi:hypothetical protein
MADECLTAIATQGRFGKAFSRIVAIVTQGHYNSLRPMEVLSMKLGIVKRSGGIEIVKRPGGVGVTRREGGIDIASRKGGITIEP